MHNTSLDCDVYKTVMVEPGAQHLRSSALIEFSFDTLIYRAMLNGIQAALLVAKHAAGSNSMRWDITRPEH